MTHYNNFIGIDIGKFNFVVTLHASDQVKTYENNDLGIEAFLSDYQAAASDNALFILETTGGYEMNLLLTLCSKHFAVHRANTRQVKNFIRSYGHAAKTDALDAKALALYGYERSERLRLYEAANERGLDLFELTSRRQDLTKMLVSEKNRRQKPNIRLTKKSCDAIIQVLEEELKELKAQINSLIKSDLILEQKKKTLMTIPGIGETVSNDLIALLPELGTLNRRQVASLVGLAPRANDSGKYCGYRTTGHGRNGVKPQLFLAAMAARNSHSPLKAYYESLIQRGKVKMVALTALMRKILVIANARIRDLLNESRIENPSS